MIPARLSELTASLPSDLALSVGTLESPPDRPDPWITGLADRADHGHGDGALCLLDDPRFGRRLQGGRFAVVLAPPHLAAIARNLAPVRWFHPQARAIFAAILEGCREPLPPPGISPQAVVDPTATIHTSASIGPLAVVGARSHVGARVVIRPGAIVGDDCTLGAFAEVGPHAVLGPLTRVGARCRIDAGAVVGAHGFGYLPSVDGCGVREAIAHIGGVVLEDDVHVGALATIARGTVGPTRIRRGARLDAQVHVGHNGEVGEGAFLAGQVGLAGSVQVGAGAWIGGQAGVADHVTVGPGARIAAASGVTGNVPAGAVFGGYPARARTQWLRATARMYRKDRS